MSNICKILLICGLVILSTPMANAQSISAEQATKIALDHAKLTQSDVGFIEVEQDYDDGILEFEINFWKENAEYEYKINANTGKIMAFSQERNRTSFKPIGPTDKLITSEEAKLVALKHANLTTDSVRFVKISQEFDYGHSSYELKFWHNYVEYEYEIDAATGEILEFSVEYH